MQPSNFRIWRGVLLDDGPSCRLSTMRLVDCKKNFHGTFVTFCSAGSREARRPVISST